MAIVNDAGKAPVYRTNVTVRRTITNVADADPITKGWLTLKRNASDADEDAVLQLIITAALSGAGQIEQDGSDGDAVVRFDIAGTDYEKIDPNINYQYDIQVMTASGALDTPEGPEVVRFRPDVTHATA